MSGLISPIELKPLQSVPGAMGLVRMVVGMEDPRNPPATLFENNFYYAWNRVKDSSRFEMNLEIPVGEQVEIKSLGELAKDLNENPPSTLDDTRCKQFDRAIDRLLDWLVKCFEVDYPYICLLNPENILVLRWSGWLPSAEDSTSAIDPVVDTTRVILADMGFLLKAGGALPAWLRPDNPYKFLWGADPEKVYRRRYPEQWYLRVVARLIAFLLMEDCGVQSESGLIEPRLLNQLPKKAAAWDMLEQAITGKFDEKVKGEKAANRLDALRIKLIEHPPSHHFLMRLQTEAPPPPQASPPSRRRWLHALLSFLLLAAVSALAFIIWRSPEVSGCRCCPNVSASSPIFKQLQEIDALSSIESNNISADGEATNTTANDNAATNSAFAQSEPAAEGSQPAREAVTAATGESLSSLPIRQDGVAIELGLILAAEKRYDEFKKQNPTTSLSVADRECLDNLLNRYLAKLGNEYELVRARLKPGLDKKSVAMLCQIKGELRLVSGDVHPSRSESSEQALPAWVPHFDRICVTYRKWLRQCDSSVELSGSENKSN